MELPIGEVRPIRDETERRLEQLIEQLDSEARPEGFPSAS